MKEKKLKLVRGISLSLLATFGSQLVTSQLNAETIKLAGNHAHHNHHSHHEHSSALAHGPMGVMGEHMHEKGGWMLSYRFMNMHMDGMRSGTDDISAAQVATTANSLGGEPMRMGNLPNGDPRIMTVPGTYRISPVDMDMKMHMFGLMYGLSDNVTAMAMLNYVEKDMTLLTFRGMNGTNEVGRFKGNTSGIGDTTIGALVKLKETPVHKFHLNVGLSLPTGSIKEKGSVLPPFSGMAGTAPGELVDIDRLAYTMQLGSGTYDFLPGITYNGKKNNLAWGAQLKGNFRLEDNSQGYRLGNIVEGTTWLAKQWKPSLSTSIRLSAKSEGGIRGRDLIITGGNPLSNVENSGRDQVALHIGVNLLGQKGALKGHRVGFEFGAPIYEDVDGIQMSNDWSATLGWHKAF